MPNKDIALLGLPGLYQNWIMCAVDKESSYSADDSNFYYKGNNIELFFKLESTQLPTNKYVINLYVDPNNFVWYLYNFLEKTDNINIKVSHLIDDLFNKAPNTVAFDFMLKHFINSYDITSKTNIEYIKNSILEYFYFFLLEKDTKFKNISSITYDNFINIEYDDFKNPVRLINKLSVLPNFDLDHFNNLYKELEKRNYQYIYRSKNFVSKIDQFDFIELSYIGTLLTDQKPLDWFNNSLREKKLKEYLDKKDV